MNRTTDLPRIIQDFMKGRNRPFYDENEIPESEVLNRILKLRSIRAQIVKFSASIEKFQRELKRTETKLVENQVSDVIDFLPKVSRFSKRQFN